MSTNTVWELEKHIRRIWDAHDKQATARINRVRLWDKETPYAMHPIWCATTLLSETSLPVSIRFDGATALLYHDVLEDTTSDLKKDLSPKIIAWIEAMTFKGGFDEEVEVLFDRPKEVRLLKLYDKTSNLMDGVWMPADLREKYITLTKRLLKDVQKEYGELNITKIADSVIKGYEAE